MNGIVGRETAATHVGTTKALSFFGILMSFSLLPNMRLLKPSYNIIACPIIIENFIRKILKILIQIFTIKSLQINVKAPQFTIINKYSVSSKKENNRLFWEYHKCVFSLSYNSKSH